MLKRWNFLKTGFYEGIRIAPDLGKIVFGESYYPALERSVIEVDPAVYDAYVGQYELADLDIVIAVTKEDNRLFVQAPEGFPKTEIYPESETKYFAKGIDVQFRFGKETNGQVPWVIFYLVDHVETAIRQGTH